jgi:thioredoxin reductase
MDANSVAIIGAGPSGLTAALQLSRYGIPTLLFEARRAGGLLWNANLVENYPGFPEGISGPELARLFLQQIEAIGVKVTPHAVNSLTYQKRTFSLFTDDAIYNCRTVVVASGTRPIPFEPELIPAEAQARVYFEAYPLLGMRDAQIAIVGAGDAAFDYALNLSRNNFITILNRSAQEKCLPLLRQRAAASDRITYHSQTRLVQVKLDSNGQLMLRLESQSGVVDFPADYLIGVLGRRANLDFVSADLLRQASRLEKQGRLYRIGDVANGRYRQTAIAAGQGLLAAMQIYHSRVSEF